MEVLTLRNIMSKREYDQRWYKKNKERLLLSKKEYYQKHKEEIKSKQREYRIKNPERVRVLERKSYQKHIKSKRDYSKQYHQKLKLEVLSHYSSGQPKCKCCGEVIIQFLTIDHIDGGGHKEREKLNRFGYNFYIWLRKNNYPENYQVLCYNCNCGKKGNNGVCPHRE